jgi:glycosyltransferase involved in cell wall biosynthesis
MNIWLLTSEFPPDFGGGISTYCLETAQMFSSYGHNITVITQDFHVNDLTITRKDSYRIIRFNPNKHYTNSFLGYEANLSYAFSQIVKELASKEGIPDIIESQEYMGIAYYLLQYKWLQYPVFKDIKVVITLHAPSFLYLEYNKVPFNQLPYFWIGEMERFCIRSADLIISPSKYLVDQLADRIKTDDLTIHILKNPYKPVEKWEKKEITKKNVIFFGKLTPQKGCLLLISYFKQLWSEGFECSLTMIGGGNHLYHPEGIDMIDFIKKLCDEEIKSGKLLLLGSIAPQYIDKHIADAHVIVIPSIVDNLPYTVPEVMNRGKVVLASIQGGQSEIIENGKDGFLFDHTFPNSFKDQIRHIFSLSDESLQEIGQKAFLKIQNDFAYENIYNKKLSLFETLANTSDSSNQFPFIKPIHVSKHLPASSRSEDELLSVVVPYYNMGRYLDETLRSIISSTHKKLEIIIVNDGSTGNENINALNSASKNYGARVINKINEGLSSARNVGAKEATGKYLAFLDPDDTIEAGYYEKAIAILRNYENVYFVGCWAKYFDGVSGYWPTFNPEPPYLLFHNMINSSALIYKKEAFINVGLNDARMVFGMEDYESVISLVENGYRGVALPEPLWNYRVRKDSMARAFTKNKQLFLYWLIAEKHKDFYSTFGTQIANLLNANGPGFNYDNPTFFYNFAGNNLITNRIVAKAIAIVKSNKILRKIAIKIKNRL